MAQQLSTNTFGTAKWIVSPTASDGTHTTIAAAITSASSGDDIFIRPGTYTENLTLKAGVNLIANVGDQDRGQVTIIGKCSMTTAGTVTITGIKLQTNSDFIFSITGTAASVIFARYCSLNMTNNTGINLASTSGSSGIVLVDSTGDVGTTGITAFSISGAGALTINNGGISNSGNSTTASTCASGGLTINNSYFYCPITTSSTGYIISTGNVYSTSATNTLCLTIGDSSGGYSTSDSFFTGTAAAISVSGGSLFRVARALINSTNANPITGAGSVNLNGIQFNGTGIGINTTTQAIGGSTNYQSVNIQTFTGSGTYTPTTGMRHCVIECIGSGGGGGGTATAAVGFYTGGGGGGGGGYARKFSTAATIGTSQSVTIGTAGTAGTAGNNAGGAGGDTSVGSICIGKGGSGGAGNAGSATSLGGAGGVAGTGDITFTGQAGQHSLLASTAAAVGYTAAGGSSYFSGTPVNTTGTQVTGQAGSNYGCGGSGGLSQNAGGTAAGGAGATGIVVITEYIG